ncbi:hypothetical protein MPSI1_002761 [Malassezia psittaci]|uniref:FAD-binding domain-containing protein n=1 Tax=Malassezia psittaci TaxID=1821823 RepID=A0AAF0FD91_9BASI|nr:hypothetical protein MPSI1_002761 [Malassezia psittaci]
MSPPQHVLIVGAGLAGPCLALSLARNNIPSTIFEIRSGPSSAGGSITLGPNALHILDKYAGIYHAITQTGFTYQYMGAYAEDGEKFGDIKVGEDHSIQGRYPAIRIMRSALQAHLLDAVKQHPGSITLKYDAHINRIQETSDGVSIHFNDNTVAYGDILIGADGVHSKVREHVLGDTASSPTFNQLCIVNGFLPTSAAKIPNPSFSFPAFMFTRNGMFMAIPVDAKAEQLAWAIVMPTTEDHTRAEWHALERSGELARKAKAEYDDILVQPVRSLLDSADDKSAKIWPVYSIGDIRTWHTDRICLIGDAAHAMPPNGLGSSLAFEDAAILTRFLIETDDSSSSLRGIFQNFERLRRARITQVREGAKVGTAFSTRTGALGWWLKRWGFRLYFWFKSGVLEHNKESTYDVDNVLLE